MLDFLAVKPFEGLLDYSPNLLFAVEQSVTSKGFGALPSFANNASTPFIGLLG